MMSQADQTLLAQALDWHDAGRRVALAWVVETWGSAPRAVGSLLVMDADGAMEGSVSGGCVEGAVLVEPLGAAMPVDLLRDLTARQAAKVPVAYVTELDGNARRLAGLADYPDRFRLDRSGVEEEKTFVAIQNPPLRMIIVGAVHIAQPLVGMARAAGFVPVLIDPRAAFGSQARFPGETIIEDWPDAAMVALSPDARTAVVTLTHDPKLDDPAITATLATDAFYLGCLGSTRTHTKRVARLQEAGFDDTAIARIHAPVGLDIGGRAPAEIAVSIIAQVIQTLRKAT